MERFEGKCNGGPTDGQMMVHWSRSKDFFRPAMPVPTSLRRDVPIIPIRIGSYELDNFGRWNWHETPEGKAYRTLFDN